MRSFVFYIHLICNFETEAGMTGWFSDRKGCGMKGVCGIMCVVAGLAAAASHAAVLVRDGFDASTLGDKANGVYKNNFHLYDAVNADVKGGTMVGLGTYNWSGNSATFKARTGGLTSGTFGTNSTGKIEYAGNSSVGTRGISRQIDTAPTANTTLYISGMLSASAFYTTNSTSYLDGGVMGFSNTSNSLSTLSATLGTGLLFGFDAGASGVDLVLWGANKRLVIQSGVSVSTTYHVVTEIVLNNVNGTNDTVKVWLNPTTATLPGDAVLTTTGNYATSGSDFGYAAIFTRAAGTTTDLMNFDELMLATEYRDVLMNPTSRRLSLVVISSNP